MHENIIVNINKKSHLELIQEYDDMRESQPPSFLLEKTKDLDL